MFFERRSHEIGPDWQRRCRARQAQLRTIIKANVDDAHQIRREAGEPTIARRSRLARDICMKPTRANGRARAAIHDVLQY